MRRHGHGRSRWSRPLTRVIVPHGSDDHSGVILRCDVGRHCLPEWVDPEAEWIPCLSYGFDKLKPP